MTQEGRVRKMLDQVKDPIDASSETAEIVTSDLSLISETEEKNDKNHEAYDDNGSMNETNEKSIPHRSLVSEDVEKTDKPSESNDTEDIPTESNVLQTDTTNKDISTWTYKPPPSQVHSGFESAIQPEMDSKARPINPPLRSKPSVISNLKPLDDQSTPISPHVSGILVEHETLIRSIYDYEPPPGHKSSQTSQSQQNQAVNVNNAPKCSNCTMQIILGEREKHHVTSMGQELFSIWTRILEEINVAKKLIGESVHNLDQKLSDRELSTNMPITTISQMQNTNVTDDPTRAYESHSVGNNLIELIPESSVPLQQITNIENKDDGYPDARASQQWLAEMEKNKRDFIEAFERVCNSIGQAKDKRQNLPSVTPAESTFSSMSDHPIRHHSVIQRNHDVTHPLIYTNVSISPNKDEGTSASQNMPQNHNSNFNSSKVEYEMKFQEIKERLDNMESNSKGLDQKVEEVINGLSNENARMADKMKGMENDILHLSKLIHELQCVTKLQMHIGGLDNINAHTG